MPTEQLGYYSIGSILPHIKGKRRRINLFANGEHHRVRIGSSTLRLFKRKGINCLACEAEGMFWDDDCVDRFLKALDAGMSMIFTIDV